MWIRLLQPFRFPEAGFGNRGRLYSPGHVREVSDAVGQVVLQTMAGRRPVAEEVRFDPVAEELTAGVLTVAEVRARTAWMDTLALDVRQGEALLPWDRTMLWDGRTRVHVDMIPRGFELLEKWDMAVPIIAGTADYDTRLVFLRRNETTERIIDLWRQSGDFAAALAEAQTKPLLCALPAEWFGHDE